MNSISRVSKSIFVRIDVIHQLFSEYKVDGGFEILCSSFIIGVTATFSSVSTSVWFSCPIMRQPSRQLPSVATAWRDFNAVAVNIANLIHVRWEGLWRRPHEVRLRGKGRRSLSCLRCRVLHRRDLVRATQWRSRRQKLHRKTYVLYAAVERPTETAERLQQLMEEGIIERKV